MQLPVGREAETLAMFQRTSTYKTARVLAHCWSCREGHTSTQRPVAKVSPPQRTHDHDPQWEYDKARQHDLLPRTQRHVTLHCCLHSSAEYTNDEKAGTHRLAIWRSFSRFCITSFRKARVAGSGITSSSPQSLPPDTYDDTTGSSATPTFTQASASDWFCPSPPHPSITTAGLQRGDTSWTLLVVGITRSPRGTLPRSPGNGDVPAHVRCFWASAVFQGGVVIVSTVGIYSRSL